MKGVKLVLVIAAGVFIGLVMLLIFLFSGRGSSWDYSVLKDAITDETTAQAHLPTADGSGHLELSCKLGQPIHLTIQARRRTGGYGDDENYVDRMVRYRIDEGAVLETVGVLGDRFIGFDTDPRGRRWDAPIIAALSNAHTLAVETETVENGKLQLVFDVRNAEAVVQRLRDECEID